MGADTARIEIRVVVAALVLRFRLALAPGTRMPEPLAGFSLRPRGGMRLQILRSDA